MCAATARGADTGATEMTTTEMRTTSAMTATAEMSATTATTAATTAAATMTAAAAMSAPAATGCIGRAGQRDRQHKNRQPFDVGHGILRRNWVPICRTAQIRTARDGTIGIFNATNAGMILRVPSAPLVREHAEDKNDLSRYSPSRSRR
jgi:CxxC motif-containing protein (DUF1111 family)